MTEASKRMKLLKLLEEDRRHKRKIADKASRLIPRKIKKLYIICGALDETLLD